MGKRAVLRVGEKKLSVPAHIILVQASKILPTISPICQITHPSVGTASDIFSVEKVNGKKKTHKSMTEWCRTLGP
jgi:hypothetical protein